MDISNWNCNERICARGRKLRSIFAALSLIPKLSYDGRTAPKSPRVIAIKPDGKVVELSHTKLIIQKTIHEWIGLFGLESLDATSEELNNLYGVGATQVMYV